jgi:perosamine synthetase
MKRISVAQPKLAGNERNYVLDCLDTNWISSNGKYIGAFEESFAAFCGVKHAIATNNGTTALHLALVVLDLQPGDEVIIPTVTYIATANAVRYCGATPVLVDVCADTMNIDPQTIESKITAKTKGIIPVHLYGHPAQMDVVNEIARKHNLWVVEDAAEAHGAEVKGSKVGSLGTCATFSFFGNKIITTGEGGMITTNDDDLAAKLRLFRGQGMDPNRRYWFPVIGYNYRMTNIQAAIGLAQMENIATALSDRDRLAGWYNEALADLKGKIVLQPRPPGPNRCSGCTTSSWPMVTSTNATRSCRNWMRWASKPAPFSIRCTFCHLIRKTMSTLWRTSGRAAASTCQRTRT